MALLAGALLLSGCNANFCSVTDKAHIAYPYEQGVTIYCDKDAVPTEYQGEGLSWKVYADNDNLYAYVPVDTSGNFAAKKAKNLNSIISSATSSNYAVPSQKFWVTLDQKVLDAAIAASGVTTSSVTAAMINPYDVADSVGGEGTTINKDSILRKYGYLKFLGTNDDGELALYANIEKWVKEAKYSTEQGLGITGSPTSEFLSAYESYVTKQINANTSCISTINGSQYGAYGDNKDWTVDIENKTWGYAWKQGFIAGLISYPVAYLTDYFANAIDPSLSGVGQILSLVIVTFIVRIFLMLVTMKGTIDQQKMQALQGDVARIQQKYPNSNENQAQKQRLAQETQALYKRNKVSPFSSIITLIIQLPLFMGVWGAFRGSAALSTGSFLGLHLSDTILSVITQPKGNFTTNGNGWWTALVLYILMIGFQFVSMKLPQWINKKKTDKIEKLTANPAGDKQRNQGKTIAWVMFIFTAVLGLSLPSAMGAYWAIGAIISIIQTLVIQAIMNSRKNKGKKKQA